MKLVRDATSFICLRVLYSLCLLCFLDMNDNIDDWAWEARELLRSRLVGKRVVCTRDYVKVCAEKMTIQKILSFFHLCELFFISFS